MSQVRQIAAVLGRRVIPLETVAAVGAAGKNATTDMRPAAD